MSDHYPITDHHPGRWGEYPEPAETTVTCACGEPLFEWQEGYSCSPGTPDEAMSEHLETIEASALEKVSGAVE